MSLCLVILIRGVLFRVVPDTPEMNFIGLYLLTGTLVFMVESDRQYWWSEFLKPNEHFIPLKSDMSDLQSQFRECCEDLEKSAEIAANGRAM